MMSNQSDKTYQRFGIQVYVFSTVVVPSYQITLKITLHLVKIHSVCNSARITVLVCYVLCLLWKFNERKPSARHSILVYPMTSQRRPAITELLLLLTEMSYLRAFVLCDGIRLLAC